MRVYDRSDAEIQQIQQNFMDGKSNTSHVNHILMETSKHAWPVREVRDALDKYHGSRLDYGMDEDEMERIIKHRLF